MSVQPEPDHILEELRQRLHLIVEQALAQPEITKQVTRARLTPSSLVTDAVDHAAASLAITNQEIATVREADSALERSISPTEMMLASRTRYSLPISLLLGGLAFAIGLAYVVSVWQAWNSLALTYGSLATFAGVVMISGMVSLLVSGMLHAAAWLLRGPSVSVSTGIFVGAFTVISLPLIPLALLWIWESLYVKIGASNAIIGSVALLAFGTCCILYLRFGAWAEFGLRALRFYTPLHRQVISRVGGVSPLRALAGSVGDLIAACVTSPFGFIGGVFRAASLKQWTYAGYVYDADWFSLKESMAARRLVALQSWDTAVAERVVVPFLRERINEVLVPGFSMTLKVHDATGLRQMRAQEYVVTTQIFDHFKNQINRIDGGSIGIAGPRGAGKTTLLEAQRAGLFLPAGVSPPVSILESVPVEYEARDFTLHLYARLCRAVIDFSRRHQTIKAKVYEQRRISPIRRHFLLLFVMLFWLAVAIFGALAFDFPLRGLAEKFAKDNWWAIVSGCATISLLGYIVYDRSRRNQAPGSVEPIVDIATLRLYAEAKLGEIRFQQKYTSGWSGKIKLPLGSEATKSNGVEWAKLAMTHPEVVHDFRQFLSDSVRVLRSVENLSSTPIVIAIDELDKVSSSEKAQQFVNEIKGLFSLEDGGCLFLVSVSEDALAGFERRGLPFRDSFDSAFDAIVRIGYLRLSYALILMRTRIVGVSDVFLCLCYCMAGGLPRDLIRVSRQLVDVEQGGVSNIDQVCSVLVMDDLINKTRAAQSLITRHVNQEPYASDLIHHLSQCLQVGLKADDLLGVVAKAPIRAPANGSDSDMATLLRLQMDTLGYIYYGATLLEVFSSALTEKKFAENRDKSGSGSFDTLASVRQMFATNSRLAWLTLNSFRESWGLSIVEPAS